MEKDRDREKQVELAYEALTGHFPGKFSAELGHHERKPYEVIIATILSQRTRDVVTHEAAARLFMRYPRLEDLAKADEDEVRGIIKPVGFYRNKASTIIEVARIIKEEHGGKVPSDMDELLKLPGVGRKTANCVLVYGMGIPAIAVDTHVHRLCNMWGWVDTKDPEETERALAEFLPGHMWLRINDLLVRFGQTICKPRKHYCDRCLDGIKEWCPERAGGQKV